MSILVVVRPRQIMLLADCTKKVVGESFLHAVCVYEKSCHGHKKQTERSQYLT